MKRTFGIVLFIACVIFAMVVNPGHGVWIFVWTTGLMTGLVVALNFIFPGKRIDQ